MSVVKEYGGLAVAAIAGVLTLAWLSKRSLEKSAEQLNTARLAIAESIGETVYDWFYPKYRKPMYSYPVIFPSGKIGAVNSEEIDPDGFFTYWKDNSRWRIAGTESGKLIAVPADMLPGEVIS